MAKTRGSLLLRFLDRYLGTLLVAFLSLGKKTNSKPSSIKAIGLLKLAGIGDLIVLSGAICDLRRTYPEAKIILFCGKDSSAIASSLPALSQVEVISVSDIIGSIKILRRHSLDILIDAEQWSRIDALLSFFSAARYTIGFRTKGQYKHALFDVAIAHLNSCHENDNFHRLLEPLGVENKTQPTLSIESEQNNIKSPYVIFHPWTVSRVKELKEWPLAYWTELGRYFKSHGYEVYISGGKSDQRASEALAGACSGHSLAGKVTLKELASFLQGAVSLVSVDTGIMHMASALDLPLIALFGPTSPKRWGPLSKKAHVLTGGEPYMYLGFERPQSIPATMSLITPEKVIDFFESLPRR